MSLITTLLGRRSIENPATPLSAPASWLMDSLGGGTATSGAQISRASSLKISGVWRSVNLYGNSVGKLPLYVYRRSGIGKVVDDTHPAYLLLRRQPNSEMTAFPFKQTLTAHALLQGNGYAYIRRLGNGDPFELLPLSPEQTFPIRELSAGQAQNAAPARLTSKGKLWYVTSVQGVLTRIDPMNVFHVKGLGYDGLQGYTVFDVARDSLGLAAGQERYAALYFRNSARPSAVLLCPNKVKDETKKNLIAGWERMCGGEDNMHRTALLELGITVKELSLSAADSQLTEQRKFSLTDIANWFGVPVHKIGGEGRTAYASLEQENQSWLDDGLDPWLVRWEEECWSKLLREEEKTNDTHTVEFLRVALLRANLEARGNYYQKAIQTGWLSRDEARGAEDMNPIPEGEGSRFYLPLNLGLTPKLGVPGPGPDPGPGAGPGPGPGPGAGPGSADDDRAALLRTGQEVLADVVRRQTKRIGQHAERAAREPRGFLAWLDQYLLSNRTELLTALQPAARIWGYLRAQPDSDSMVEWTTLAWRTAYLNAAGEATAQELLAGHLKRINAELPDRLATEAVGAFFGDSHV